MLTGTNALQNVKYHRHRHRVSETFKTIRLESSFVDLKELPIWRATLSEFLATCLFVIFSISAGNTDPDNQIPEPTILRLALANGLVISTIIWIFGDVSGAHVNPAVTMGFVVARRITGLRALLYLGSQISGALIGAAIARVLVYEAATGNLGITLVHNNITTGQAFSVEFLMTFLLMLTIMASSDNSRSELKGSKPLTIGLCVAMNCFIFVHITGASMNPARSLGPAIITRRFEDHWLYWVAPTTGACAGAVFYDQILHQYASIHRFMAYLTQSDYGPEEKEYPRQTFWKHIHQNNHTPNRFENIPEDDGSSSGGEQNCPMEEVSNSPYSRHNT